MFSTRTILVYAAVLLASGCALLQPDYKRPATELPQAWRDTPADAVTLDAGPWWKVYNDATLDQLIDEALADNASVAAAAARVEQARAALHSTSAAQWPQVAATAGRNRTGVSSVGAVPFPPGFGTVYNDNQVALDASYEVDLWGRLRNATTAARADLLASDAARETVRISLTADVARGYFALRAIDDQLASTRRSLADRTESLQLEKRRFDLGDISEFDYRQLQAEVDADRAQIPQFEQQRSEQANALAILLGRSPQAIYDQALGAGADEEDAASPVVVPSGLPSGLLLRRPDLVQAEQTLIAANARVTVARAAYFPQITLTGYLGSESTSLSQLFSGPAGIFQAALGLTQPIFTGGRIDAQVEAAKAQEQIALQQYRLAVQTAFAEVRNAIVAQSKARERLAADRDRVATLRVALQFAQLRYTNGIASQIDVLDSERNLLAAEQDRAAALLAQRAAIADLFKALGGTWSS
jgi:multidrug efflux system outer membrane protein